MKTNIIILGAVVTAFAFTSFAAEPLLTPRAKGNQIKIVNSSVPTSTVAVAYVAPSAALLTPRAKDNQSAKVVGTNNDINPALVCARTMVGSPKAITACTSHTTMPGCVTVATLK